VVRSTAVFASRRACAVFHLVVAGRRRLLPHAVRWKTRLLDLAYFVVAVALARTRELASASSTASAVLEVCCCQSYVMLMQPAE